MGIVSALGQGIPVLTQALLTGRCCFTKSTRFPDLSFPVIAAELQGFYFENALTAFTALQTNLITSAYKAGRRAPLTIQASLIAALEAWQQAELHLRMIDKTRIGLVIAGQNTTQAYQHALRASHRQDITYLSPTYALQFMDTDQVGTLSEVLGIQGEGFNVGGASASGNLGIIQGHRLIQQGLVDVCLVVGVLADLSPFEIQGFYNIGALGGRQFQDNPFEASRPFDSNHEGFILGQASGALILESAVLAKKSKIFSLGKIVGMGMALDGNRSSDPTVQGETRAMQQALMSAKMIPTDIAYLNTHGSSSIVGDEAEILAIRTVFGESTRELWLNSTKSILGHCLWSAGVVEAIATLTQLQGDFLHPNLNLANPIDTECRFVGPKAKTVSIKNAMSNSFGFGGINTSVIFTTGE